MFFSKDQASPGVSETNPSWLSRVYFTPGGFCSPTYAERLPASSFYDRSCIRGKASFKMLTLHGHCWVEAKNMLSKSFKSGAPNLKITTVQGATAASFSVVGSI